MSSDGMFLLGMAVGGFITLAGFLLGDWMGSRG